MTNGNFRVPGGKGLVLAVVGVGLALILGTSLSYRLDNSSIVVTPRMPQGMGQMPPQNMPPQGAEGMPPGMGSGMPQGMGSDMPPRGGSDMNAVMQRMTQDPEAMNAMQKLMASLREKPNDPETMLAIAERFMKMGVAERAEIFANRALVAEPANEAALYLLGVIAFDKKDYPAARDRFTDVLGLHPGKPDASFNLGVLYKYYLNEAAKAEELFKSVAAAHDTPDELRGRAQKELEK